jgi:hypothetical protein
MSSCTSCGRPALSLPVMPSGPPGVCIQITPFRRRQGGWQVTKSWFASVLMRPAGVAPHQGAHLANAGEPLESRSSDVRSARPPQARGRREWEHARHDVENPSSSRAGGDDSPSCAVGTMTTHPPFRTAYTDSAPGSDVRSRRGRIRHRRWAERQPEEPHAHGTHPRSNVGSATAGKSVPSTL